MSTAKEAKKTATDKVVHDGPTPQAIRAWKDRADKLVAAQAELDAAVATLTGKLDPIRKEHEPNIEKLRAKVSGLATEIEEFGILHRKELFAEGSEIRTEVAIIAGRETPESVTLEEGLDVEEVIKTMDSDRRLKTYLAVKKSLDKTALKKALKSAGDAIRESIEAVGLTLEKGFSVKVKPKGE